MSDQRRGRGPQPPPDSAQWGHDDWQQEIDASGTGQHGGQHQQRQLASLQARAFAAGRAGALRSPHEPILQLANVDLPGSAVFEGHVAAQQQPQQQDAIGAARHRSFVLEGTQQKFLLQQAAAGRRGSDDWALGIGPERSAGSLSSLSSSLVAPGAKRVSCTDSSISDPFVLPGQLLHDVHLRRLSSLTGQSFSTQNAGGGVMAHGLQAGVGLPSINLAAGIGLQSPGAGGLLTTGSTMFPHQLNRSMQRPRSSHGLTTMSVPNTQELLEEGLHTLPQGSASLAWRESLPGQTSLEQHTRPHSGGRATHSLQIIDSATLGPKGTATYTLEQYDAQQQQQQQLQQHQGSPRLPSPRPGLLAVNPTTLHAIQPLTSSMARTGSGLTSQPGLQSAFGLSGSQQQQLRLPASDTFNQQLAALDASYPTSHLGSEAPSLLRAGSEAGLADEDVLHRPSEPGISSETTDQAKNARKLRQQQIKRKRMSETQPARPEELDAGGSTQGLLPGLPNVQLLPPQPPQLIQRQPSTSTAALDPESRAKERKVKNRESAARSRQKRLQYTEELEDHVKALTDANQKLMNILTQTGIQLPAELNTVLQNVMRMPPPTPVTHRASASGSAGAGALASSGGGGGGGGGGPDDSWAAGSEGGDGNGRRLLDRSAPLASSRNNRSSGSAGVGGGSRQSQPGLGGGTVQAQQQVPAMPQGMQSQRRQQRKGMRAVDDDDEDDDDGLGLHGAAETDTGGESADETDEDDDEDALGGVSGE